MACAPVSLALSLSLSVCLSSSSYTYPTYLSIYFLSIICLSTFSLRRSLPTPSPPPPCPAAAAASTGGAAAKLDVLPAEEKGFLEKNRPGITMMFGVIIASGIVKFLRCVAKSKWVLLK